MPNNVLTPHLPSLEAAKLGRFIVSIKNPLLGTHDPEYAIPPVAIPTTQLDFSESHQKTRDNGLSLNLTSFLSLSISRRTDRIIQVSGDSVTIHTLSDALTKFQEATALEATRKWLESMFDQREVYFIVGYRTILNATFSVETSSARSASGEAQVPLAVSLAGIGIVLPLEDPSLGGHHEAVDSNRVQVSIPGESICALQYLKLKPFFLSSSKLDKAKLSKNPQWKRYDMDRSAGQKGVEDILEVSLEEDDEDPDGKWDLQTLSGEEKILIPK